MASEKITTDGSAPLPISAIIVNFNAGDYLRAAAASLLQQEPPPAEIIVVDNGSRDDSLGKLRAARLERVRILEIGRNTGFAYACNEGIRVAASEHVLLMNPDCEMPQGTLTRLLGVLEKHPTAGMAGPRTVNPDGTEQRGSRRDIPTPWRIFAYTFRLHRLMPRHPRFRDFNQAEQPLPDRPVAVPAISGACILVRRAAIDRVGLLDSERFFLHFEDLDWCLRFTQTGFEVLFVPDVTVRHVGGISSASRPVRVELYKHVSLVRFLRKHFTAYYPSAFMAMVVALVFTRFAFVAAGKLLRRK